MQSNARLRHSPTLFVQSQQLRLMQCFSDSTSWRPTNIWYSWFQNGWPNWQMNECPNGVTSVLVLLPAIRHTYCPALLFAMTSHYLPFEIYHLDILKPTVACDNTLDTLPCQYPCGIFRKWPTMLCNAALFGSSLTQPVRLGLPHLQACTYVAAQFKTISIWSSSQIMHMSHDIAHITRATLELIHTFRRHVTLCKQNQTCPMCVYIYMTSHCHGYPNLCIHPLPVQALYILITASFLMIK